MVKPAEQATLAILRMIEIIQETDLPSGVLNVVTGLGVPTGDSLISHNGIDKVRFHGKQGNRF